MLAALLTVLLLTLTLCVTAFAENPVEVLIPQGSDTNAILTAALIPDATETKSWEYKCEGTSKIFTKNTAWGSVNGFESSTKSWGITTTYTHAALAANTDGQYQVRVAGTTKEYTIEKKAKLTSGIELNTGVSVALVYGEDGTLDAAATEDAIVRAVVKSVKPADAALTVEYYATATSGSLGSAGKDWMPIAGGKSGLLTYPAISAGEQQIRVSYNGGADYKPSTAADGTVTIDKASVKVHVKSASMYVSEAANGLDLVTTDPVDNFDTYVIYAGLTSNVTTALYVQLPARYTSNSTLLAIVDKALAVIGQPTLTELLQNGTTVGELRKMLSASEIIDALDKIGVDTGVLGQVIQVIDKLPGIADNVRIAFGSPNHAGIYAVTAVTDNRNYKTGVGVGALVLKADKAKLVWKQDISKISAANAANADFMAELTVNGVAVADQSSVHVLYSGFTSKWKPYSSTTTPPTEPGRYVMTVVVLGGDYVASPVTRTFRITK